MAGLGMSHSPTLMTSGGINQVFIDSGRAQSTSRELEKYFRYFNSFTLFTNFKQ